jgi:putative ABC transport system permease protein
LPRLTEVSISFPVVGFMVVVSLGTVLLFGLMPAFHASRVDTQVLLKEGGRGIGGGRRRRAQRFLVVSEVALAVALLVGSGLLVRTLMNLLDVDPGFEPDGRVALQVSLPRTAYPDPESVSAFLDRLHEQLDAIPGVQASASSVGLPFQTQLWRKQITVEGQPAATLPEVPVVDLSIVTPGWLETLGIPLVRGRPLRGSDTPNAPFVALVNEAFARAHFSGQNALGQRLRLAPPDDLLQQGGSTAFPWYTIVGVVGDVRRWDLAADAFPEVFITQSQDMDVAREFYVVVHATPPEAGVIAPMRRAVSEADPTQPVSWVRPMDSMYSEMVALPRFSALLVGGFGVAALLLSVLGVYGLIAHDVSARIREFGLRMALGAPSGRIMRSVVGDAVRTTLLGIVVGLLLAGAVTRALGNLLFDVAALDITTYLVVVLLVLLVAAAAALGPSRRAARLDPTAALRSE